MREVPLRGILDELGITVVNKTSKGWLVASCPFAALGAHGGGTDRNPSFNIHVNDRGITGFKCHTCKQKGTVRQLVTKLEYFSQSSYGNLSLRAVLAETPDSFDDWDTAAEIEPDPEPLIKAAYIGMWPLAWEHPAARAYLDGRGVTERTATIMQMQYDPEECRILVPVYDKGGDLFGFTGRSIMDKEQFPYPRYKKTRDYAGLEKARNILGIHEHKPGKPIWVVEGQFALAHAYDIGLDRYVTPVATMGANLSLYQRDMLAELGEAVFLCYDNDSAGEDGLYGIWDIIQSRHEGGGAVDLLREHVPTFIPLYPPGINDPDFLSLEQAIWMKDNAVLA